MVCNWLRHHHRQKLLLRYVERELIRHHGRNSALAVRNRMIETAKGGDMKANKFWSLVYASLKERHHRGGLR